MLYAIVVIEGGVAACVPQFASLTSSSRAGEEETNLKLTVQ